MDLTHEELLEKIQELCGNCLGLLAGAILTDALSAVVKLHKPQEITLPDGNWGTNCQHCDIGLTYPCPTIQAIQKQLGYKSKTSWIFSRTIGITRGKHARH